MPNMLTRPLQQHAATFSAHSVLSSAYQCAQQLSTKHYAPVSGLHSVVTKMPTRLRNAYERGSHTTEASNLIYRTLYASAMVKLPGQLYVSVWYWSQVVRFVRGVSGRRGWAIEDPWSRYQEVWCALLRIGCSDATTNGSVPMQTALSGDT